jgi:hypothetical protein
VLPCLAMLYLATKPSHMGVDGDVLTYDLQLSEGRIVLPDRHCPVPSLTSGQWPLSRGAKPSDLDI